MPQTRGGTEQRRSQHAGSQHAGYPHAGYQRVLRIACAVLAVGLAVGAVWLIVTAKTTKKALVKLKCRTCNYTIERLGIRLRKLEVGQ